MTMLDAARAYDAREPFTAGVEAGHAP
jgi:hypothetical protein